MNSNSSGGRLEGFLTGKGFYIVLFLCAVVIGISVWMMAAGDRTMEEDLIVTNQNKPGNQRVETVIIPPAREQTRPVDEPYEESVEVMAQPKGEETEAAETPTTPVEKPAPYYAWPVEGAVDRDHNRDVLKYDVTMQDWRVHEGIDILAPLGTTVCAAHSGLVESIVQDDMMGTVLTVAHGDGGRTVYANLAETPAVSVGQWVEQGTVLGSVGTTALAEIGQETHLHFAITVDGINVDPLAYLPA